MTESKATLVIGLGNPILGDDGVGWHVAEACRASLNGHVSEQKIEFDFLTLGGLSLMERMVGYSDVIVVDSIVTGNKPIGTIYSMALSSLPNFSAGHTTSSHDASLQTALEFGRQMGFDLPEDVWVVAVEAQHVYDFSEQLSSAIALVVPKAAEIVRVSLEKDLREDSVYDLV